MSIDTVEKSIAIMWTDIGNSDPTTTSVLSPAEWNVAGVSVRFTRATEPLYVPAGIRVSTESGTPHLVELVASSPEDAVSAARPVALGLVAYLKGALSVRGTLVGGADTGHFALVVGDALDAQNVVGSRDVLLEPLDVGVQAHFLPDGTGDPLTTVMLDGFLVPVADRPMKYVAPKMLQSHLRAHLSLSVSQLARALGSGGADFLHAYERGIIMRSEEIALALPASAIEVDELVGLMPRDAKPAIFPQYPVPQAAYASNDLSSLRAMQRVANDVYGRLESDRALSWAAEEFGEVARAIRRHEPKVRISEELGQLFSWVVCLANITGVDLADSASQALKHEALRQVMTHGHLRPYMPSAEYWTKQ